MDYKKHYDRLISTRKLLNREKGKGIYYEKHHIIPKCCGGLNNKQNLILLTAKEHYVAHYLLIKIYGGELKNKLYYAFWRMIKGSEIKKILSANQYEKHRIEFIKNQIGYKHSEETKRKIGEKGKGRICSEETKNKMSKKHKGKNLSVSARKKLSDLLKENKRCLGFKYSEEAKEKMKLRTHSEETKKKISEKNKNRIFTKEARENMSKAKSGKSWSEARRKSFENKKAARS